MLLHNFHRQNYLIVEGNIGAGKSTFLDLLDKKLSVQVVYEPCEKWKNVGGENILDAFYKDGTRWGYTFQSYAFISRILAQEEAAQKNSRNLLQVLERSVYSDRYCFAKNCYSLGLMNHLEWSIYLSWFDTIAAQHIQPPLAFIYLQADPEICYERLLKRNRKEEKLVGLEYLQELHKYHEDWLLHKKGVLPFLRDIPVLVIPCNDDFEHNSVRQTALIEEIVSFCTKQLKIDKEKVKIFNKIE